MLGRVLYGRMPGVHLDAEGCRQAQVLAQALKQRYKIDEVVSSPLARAVETARFIADAQDIDVSIDEGMNEVEVGSWTGRPFGELFDTEEWKKYNELRSTTCPPGGEFITQVQTRAWSSIGKIVAHHPDEDDSTVAIVSHGDVIRALLILLLGMPVDHIHRLEVGPASASEILLGRGQPRVLAINQLF